MPAVSRAQQRLFGAAEHGADFPMAEKLRETMKPSQLHDFAVGPMTNKPEHVSMLQGNSNGIVGSNTSSLRNLGQSEFSATTNAIRLSKMGQPKKPAFHPNRHKNLGKFLHPAKGR